jgi:hypothetical protein
MLNKLLICCFSAPSFEKYVENKYMLMFPSSVIPKIKKKNVVKTCLIDKKKSIFISSKQKLLVKFLVGHLENSRPIFFHGWLFKHFDIRVQKNMVDPFI